MSRFLIIGLLPLVLAGAAPAQEYWATIPYPENMTTLADVSSISVDGQGMIWIGNYFGKIYHYTGDSWIVYEPNTMGINCADVSDILHDSQGRTWFSTQRGLNDSTKALAFFYKEDTWTQFSFHPGIQYITRMAEEADGTLWFAGDGGVVKLSTDMNWVVYTKENSGLPGSNVGDVVIDGNNVKWFSVNGILVSFDGTEWKSHPRSEFSRIWQMTASKGSGVCCSLSQDTMKAATFDRTWQEIYISYSSDVYVMDLHTDSNGAYWMLVSEETKVRGILKYDGYRWVWYTTNILGISFTRPFCIGPGDRKYFLSYTGVRILSDTPLGVEDTIPVEFAIAGNRPNPFNPSTTISFTLPASGNTELAVYSITGQKVRTLLSGHSAAGAHEVVWDGRDEAGVPVSSGVYFARITAGSMVSGHKMLLMK